MPSLTSQDIIRLRDMLFFDGPDAGRKTSRFWLLMLLSGVIATTGVIGDSIATLIGAMIVAPLMVPILGTVVAIVLGDRRHATFGITLVTTGALSVIAIAFGLGLLIDTPIVAATNDQVAARVTPRLVDLVAALATGVVGAVAMARDDIADTLPGVAIAISLVPPLAVIGLTAESGAYEQSLGAALLFATNVTAILAAGLVVMAVFRLNRFASKGTHPGPSLHRWRAVIVVALSLVVISVPLALTSMHISTVTRIESQVGNLVSDWAAEAEWEMIETTWKPPDEVVVRVSGPDPAPDTDELRSRFADSGIDRVRIDIELMPTTRVLLGDD